MTNKLRTEIILMVVAFILSFVGCEDSSIKSPDSSVSNFGGTYIFMKKDNGFDHSYKFIRNDIKDGTNVVITQENKRLLTLSYELQDGHKYKREIYLKDEGIKWTNSTLNYSHTAKPDDAPILPGYARQTRSARLYKNQDGDLVLESSFRELGLMLFIIPFMDHYKSKIILRHI